MKAMDNNNVSDVVNPNFRYISCFVTIPISVTFPWY